MSSIYGAGFANFTPNVLGTQELTTAIQSVLSSTGTTSRTNEDLILETKTANNVVVKANNTTVATFTAINPTQPTIQLIGIGPRIDIAGNSTDSSYDIPGLKVTNQNRTLFVRVPGTDIPTNPYIGSSTSDVDLIAAVGAKLTLKSDRTLTLKGSSNSVTISANAASQDYTLSFPAQLPPFEQSLQVNQTGAMSYRSTFIPVAFSNATSNAVTTVQSAGPPIVWPEVVYVATIPANAMGTNGMLKIAMAVRRSNTSNDIFFGVAASTNNTMSIVGDLRLLGTVGSVPFGQSIGTTSLSYFVDNFYLYLNNSTSVLKHRNSPLAGLSGGTYGTATINTTQTWYLKVFLSTANAATSAFLESVLVETLYA
jgi:hypothetical protein